MSYSELIKNFFQKTSGVFFFQKLWGFLYFKLHIHAIVLIQFFSGKRDEALVSCFGKV